jgi:hypothetical protein
MKYIIILATFIFWFPIQAKTISYGKSVVTISIPFGKPTLFKFDKLVRTISPVPSYSLRPANLESPDYAVLTVEPKDPLGDALIAVILEDDTAIKIRLKTVQADKKDLTDPMVEFKAYEVVGDKNQEDSNNTVSEIDLMKALIRDDYISGFDRRELDRVIETAQKGISTRLIRQYESEGLHGYVFRVTNQMETSPVTIDLRQLKLGRPNLAILSQADQLILKGKSSGRNETLLRIVAKPTARYSDIRIPIGVRKPESEEKQ